MDTERLKELAKEILLRKDVQCLVGYEKGTYGFRVAPCFLTSPQEIDRLIISPLCIHNLTNYLTLEEIGPLHTREDSGRYKIAIVVKGCDSKAVVNLIAEKGISRENLLIIGIPCEGVVDIKKLEKRFPGIVNPGTVERKEEKFIINADGTTTEVPLEELLSKRCKHCKHPTPVLYDKLVGKPAPPREDTFEDVKTLEKDDIQKRWLKWQNELSRCIRCYACRNICPMCYCTDCALDRLKPQLIRRSVNFQENILFHITRAFHLAGRCIECEECERACPQGIPLMELNRKLLKDSLEMFNYETGINPENKPLFSTFNPDDPDEGIL